MKLAVICLPGFDGFLKDLIPFLKEKFTTRTFITSSKQEMLGAYKWADIIWIDWANEQAIFIINEIQHVPWKKIICRIRSYEVLAGYLPHIKWDRVDRVLYVAEHIREAAQEIHPQLKGIPNQVIKNGVNLERFLFLDGKPGFNLAVMGFINHKKNPAAWIEIMARLVAIDKRYTLKIAGDFQDPRYKFYFEQIIPEIGLEKNIKFCGYQKDILGWFKDEEINYLLSTSIWESFGFTIAEAMAMGIRPVIHHFWGAEEIWLQGCLFSTTEEAIKIIQDEKTYNSVAYRTFVDNRYSLRPWLENMEKVIKDLAQELPRKSPDYNLTQHIIQHSSGAQIKINAITGDHMSKSLEAGRFYEKDMLNYIQSLGPGKNIVDVGAHIGHHALFFAMVCKAKAVYVFEPDPKAFKILEQNLELNKATNIISFQVALGSEKSKGKLEYGPWPHTGMTKVWADEVGEVEIWPFDSFYFGSMANSDPIDIIKIDVEGMSAAVLKGALEMLKEDLPVLFVECATQEELIEVKSIIEPLGYRSTREPFGATPVYLFKPGNQGEGPDDLWFEYEP